MVSFLSSLRLPVVNIPTPGKIVEAQRSLHHRLHLHPKIATYFCHHRSSAAGTREPAPFESRPYEIVHGFFPLDPLSAGLSCSEKSSSGLLFLLFLFVFLHGEHAERVHVMLSVRVVAGIQMSRNAELI